MLLALGHASIVINELALDKFTLGGHMLLLRILVLVRLFDLCNVRHRDSADSI